VIEDQPGPANAGVRFPPPLLFVAGLAASFALDRVVLRLRLVGDDANRAPLLILGWLGIVSGVAFSFWGIRTFRRAGTSVVPNRPARTVVASGPYRWSRNPMYVGFTAVYLGVALIRNAAWPLIILPVVLIVLWLLVIRREERYLTHAFGDEYVRYRQRVRRWL
jgi:protein-S-isoprenylcysteine O-methyltransferase Ste14